MNDGGKEIICTQCDHEEFETKKELREHLKESHGGVGLDKLSYKCSEVECSFETRTQVLLNEHKMEVHGISTTYKCKVRVILIANEIDKGIRCSGKWRDLTTRFRVL